jgi:prepilin-type N-terminal cleavage/methylation domain-containing protein
MNLRVKKGLTLIEIMVAIGIISILALISIPAFRTYKPKLEMSGTVRELAGDLRYVQQMAVTEQKEYCIKFFPSERKYQTLQCGAATFLKEKIISEEIQTLTVSGFTNNEVRYNPYGAVSEAGSVVFYGIKSGTKTILIKPSGFVEIVN